MRRALLYLDREPVFVPNLDGGVLQRKMIINCNYRLLITWRGTRKRSSPRDSGNFSPISSTWKRQ